VCVCVVKKVRIDIVFVVCYRDPM